MKKARNESDYLEARHECTKQMSRDGGSSETGRENRRSWEVETGWPHIAGPGQARPGQSCSRPHTRVVVRLHRVTVSIVSREPSERTAAGAPRFVGWSRDRERRPEQGRRRRWPLLLVPHALLFLYYLTPLLPPALPRSRPKHRTRGAAS
jgi:hypothetical protein